MTQRRPSHLEVPPQVAQRFPLLPQFEFVVPETQLPNASQHPEQLVGPQPLWQSPAAQLEPGAQLRHAVPSSPQFVALPPTTHVSPRQQPRHVPGPHLAMQRPNSHMKSGQELQAVPPRPQARFEVPG